MTPYAFGKQAAGGPLTKTAVNPMALMKTIGRVATQAPVSSALKRLPPKYQKPATLARRAIGAGTLGATAYGGYRGVQNAAGDMSTAAAQQMGVNDPAVLQEVNQRAQQQAFPMLYRALAPAALGGDNTDIGKNMASAVGTAAYYNAKPQTLLPAPHAMTPTSLATTAPALHIARHVLPARPTGQQMLANIPAEQQQQMFTNVGAALLAPQTASPLAKKMQHVFEPAVNYQQKKLTNMLGWNR